MSETATANASARTPSPFEPHSIEVDGLRLHYVDEGAGEPVLMVHGNPTWSYYYRNLVRALSDRHRCIVPDHIGCGLSDKPADDRYDYTLERRAKDVGTLLDRLGIGGPINLVVHDWGGMIALTWALALAPKPDATRIRRLVLLNTSGFHLPATKRMPWQLTLCRTPGVGALLVRGLNGFCRYAAKHCFQRPVEDAVKRAYEAPYDTWRNRIAVHRFVQDIPLKPGDRGYDLISHVDAALAELHATPTLIAWGMRDFVFDHHFLGGWETRLPHAEVHRFDDAGHYVLEDAADEIVPLVRDFLARPVDREDDAPAEVERGDVPIADRPAGC